MYTSITDVNGSLFDISKSNSGERYEAQNSKRDTRRVLSGTGGEEKGG